MKRYSLTFDDNVMEITSAHFDEYHEMIACFGWGFRVGYGGNEDWLMVLTDREKEVMIYLEKTDDGFLFSVFPSEKKPYSNFPVTDNVNWIYSFGDGDKPCCYWMGGEDSSYLPQKFYIPFEEAEKMVQLLEEKGMDAFVYDSDRWQKLHEHLKSVEMASEEIQRQVLGENYALLYDDGENDDD